MSKALRTKSPPKTTRRGPPLIVEAAEDGFCPVAPLAREYAAIIRARKAIDRFDKDMPAEGKALLALTDRNTDLGALSAEHVDKLLLRRGDAIECRARNLAATSRMGVAFQLLLAHGDDLKNSLPAAEWDPAPKALQELSGRLDAERGPMIWTAYRYLVRGWQDPDLQALESILGREGLTDPEAVAVILAAA